MLRITERVAEAGARFRPVAENIAMTTPADPTTRRTVDSSTEIERAMIRARTSAGLAVADTARPDDISQPTASRIVPAAHRTAA